MSLPAASPASDCERGKRFTTKGTETGAQRARRVIAVGFLAGVDGRGFSLESGGKTAALQSAAVAAVGKGERTQRGTVLGAIGGHGSLQKERLDLGFLGEPRGGEAHFRTKIVKLLEDCAVIQIFVLYPFG